jgi:catechol 2,3-dioxygenase-like lactoylglutathione lyase family enzyme
MADSRSDVRFRVSQIDHVELFVPDRDEAAKWYEEVLGLTVLRGYEDWAKDPHGPLMISSDDGSTKLALFEGDPRGPATTTGFQLVAFRVLGADFIQFLAGLSDVLLTDTGGGRLTPAAVVDHDTAYSIYFNDSYGHQLEITTYEYDVATRLLRDAGWMPSS